MNSSDILSSILNSISKLLPVKKDLRWTYKSMESYIHPNAPAVIKEDEFITTVTKLITANISDENFGITQICRRLGVSRTQLHNKLTASTSMSTSIFIRTLRLHIAKGLLETTHLNISQVAYEVGFKHPSYFSELFSRQFGLSAKP